MTLTKELRNYGASITYEAADTIDALDKAFIYHAAELATLRAENERLRDRLEMVVLSGAHIQARNIAKEALK